MMMSNILWINYLLIEICKFDMATSTTIMIMIAFLGRGGWLEKKFNHQNEMMKI